MKPPASPAFPGPLAIDELAPDARIGAGSAALAATPGLSVFFDDRLITALDARCAGAVGWGLKPSGARAATFATRRALPFARLEDGFLRSVGLGKNGAATVSIVVDDLGVYYDATRPSRLERLLASRAAHVGEIRARAARALERWRAEGLSKYNLGDDRAPAEARGRIVVVDQVLGDLSLAGVAPDIFACILDHARSEGVEDRLVLRAHPDVMAGRARGLMIEAARAAGVAILADDCAPAALVETARDIWTVSSALGFEALLRGASVTTFGTPFYAGWGLTRDLADGAGAEAAFARRGVRLDVEEMFGAAFLLYPRYADPVRMRRCDFDAAVDRILDWRARDRALAGPPLHCYGFSRWKRRACEAMLGGTRRRLVFHGAARRWSLVNAPESSEAEIAVWGVKESRRFRSEVEVRGHRLTRVEDGFIRSVGLGSDLRWPGSLVADGAHLYYDGSGPSRLETLLETATFDAEILGRAERLIARLLADGVTKYNMRVAPPDLRAAAAGRRVTLVAEQVPADAAIVRSGAAITPNLGLLKAVRAERPDAFIVYKEHPDLVAGNRAGRTAVETLSRYADLVISEGDLGAFYDGIDELHAISSLAGFEALLRGVSVTCWGLPFYAGWGLTRDHASCPRRTRHLSLPELVAAALILYPCYADPVSRVPCSVEDFLDAIEVHRQRGGTPATRRSLFGRVKEKWKNFFGTPRYG